MATPKFYALQEIVPEAPSPSRTPIEGVLREEVVWEREKSRVVLERSIAMKAPGTKRGPAPKCPVCGRFIGQLEWLPPYRVEIETWGTAFGDVMIAGTADLVVSSAFCALFEQNKLFAHGVFESVEVAKVIKHRKLSAKLPVFFKRTLPVGPVRIDHAASEFIWSNNEEPCPNCMWPKGGFVKGYKGLVIDASTWAGEDLFHPYGTPVNFIVTERFRTMCEENGVTNVEFEAVENCILEIGAR